MSTQKKTKHRLPTHVVPLRYKIMLKPDLDAFTFTGEETIHLTINKPTRQITLHSHEIEIESAEFVQKEKETWAGKISYDALSETATFSFPKPIQKGSGQLKLRFVGRLNDKMRGFYRSKFQHEGVDKYLATTQFESTDARRAFPCFDEPAQKAIFDVTLMIPAHTTAISNTIESNILEHEVGYKIVQFEPTPKMSTYLLAFIVGEFEYIEDKTHGGVLIRVFTTPGKKEQAKFSLDTAIKCLEFYNNYFGIDYPLPVMDMIAIPDFAAGAMENWGAVTYRESTLLVDEEKTSVGNKQWVALVIAHELAHQWFGNLVTMEWWTHLWLNEGFASFVEYLAIDHIFPEWDIWTQFMASEMGVAFGLDALQNTHPIEVEVGHPAEISEIFDKVSYAKGATILRMLWQYLGEKDFQKGLQHYLKKYSYSNAETEDLWRALEEVSGKPVLEVMENWTSKAGHPVVAVSQQGKNLKLTQSRFFSSPISRKKSKDKTIWSIPFKIQRSKIKDKNEILMDRKSINIDKPKEGEWIKLNAGEASFVRVDYPQNYLGFLEKAITHKQLPTPDKIGLIRDAFSLAQSGGSPTTAALELAQSYKEENDYTVWLELSTYLSQLDSLLAHEPFYEQYRNYGREMYKGIAKRLGWEKKDGEQHTHGLARGIVLYKLGSYGDKDTISHAQGLFNRLKKEKIHSDLRGVVYNLVAENGEKKEFDKLLAMYKEEDNQQEKERIGRALGLFKNKVLLAKTLDFSISNDVRYQNTLGIIASVWKNPSGRYLAWEFVKAHFQFLKERYAGGHYFTRVFGPASDFTKISDAKDIERFVQKHPTPEAKRTIAQALEQIYSNAAWLARDRKGLELLLEKW